MANTTYYDAPKNYILENISDKTIKVQLYRVNLWEEIPAGDSIVITCDSSEEGVYYTNLALAFGNDNGVPTVLSVRPAE